MKVVPLSEAKANLSRYAKLCHDEPVVITVNGKPSFQLVPFEESDDLIDQLIDQHPGFRDLLEMRLHERNRFSGKLQNAGSCSHRPKRAKKSTRLKQQNEHRF